MKSSIICPVCGLAFVCHDPEPGTVLICPICGAKIVVTAIVPEISAHKFPQEPEVEIIERIENFARLRGYVFNEDKDLFITGLLAKKHRYGDFFCPCRYQNVQENLCPCLETRSNLGLKDGRCHCGLFNLPASKAGPGNNTNP